MFSALKPVVDVVSHITSWGGGLIIHALFFASFCSFWVSPLNYSLKSAQILIPNSGDATGVQLYTILTIGVQLPLPDCIPSVQGPYPEPF